MQEQSIFVEALDKEEPAERAAFLNRVCASGGVGDVTFSPDGKRLASTSRDNSVKVWDAQTGQELLTVEGHSEYWNGVAFSPDGHRLASGAAGGAVKIWDATPLPEKP